MRQKTFEDIVNEAAVMRKGIEELEAALQGIRGGASWELDVQKDSRLSVRLLYGELKAHRASLTSFLATVITGTAS